ncbi:uncharacterized protein BJ212DRAFT_1446566 [Suillus subaureus]|uniref:C2H2-type domain-containing protein n=1 Tax=Suillus subaureus TaxID=48587 RepID=A0A9P7JEQ1_9AGAM|nr:uncharacterized protein BJ212DRAFT_1446566 [Suillus subaureus]KAG1818094.1 hypothetical protein BJ212DRAFT_1446566 [Suillus subaureus]
MSQSPREPSSLCISCMKPGCNCWFRNWSGYTQHMNAKHPAFLTPPCPPSFGLVPDITDHNFGDTSPMDDEDPLQSMAEFLGTGDQLYRNYYPFLLVSCSTIQFLLNDTKKYTYIYIAHPCDPDSTFLPPGTPPPPLTEKSLDDWTPCGSCVKFKLADYLFTRNQTPTYSINQLLNIWAASLVLAGSKFMLFSDHCNLYKTIDNAPLGDVKWQSFSVKYTGTIPDEDALSGYADMTDSHDVWFYNPCDVVQNMLANPEFATEMNLQLYRKFTTENDEHQWKDFMSGDWSWAHTDKISKDPDTHGLTFVPVILGSDKMTVSVATGQNDYYSLYTSIGNVQNNVCHTHRGAVAVIGFLAMPKMIKEHAETPGFRNFQCQLFHSSLSFILKNLKPAMTKPEVAQFRDGHYQHVIYRLGPHIVDYEEQVLLTCILQNWCAKNLDDISLCHSRSHMDALIEECNSGTLKSKYGLVGELVPFTNDFPHADIHELLTPDILHQLIKGAYKDHLVEIAAVPPFPGLRRFPQGHHFKQWTGDNSKALMKVYLPTIEGYVLVDVVCAFQALLEFCYLIHCNVITKKSLSEIEDVLTCFCTYHKVFKTTRVVTTFSLPRQHSMSHYALGQMLLTNQCLDKLAASHMDFHVHGMLTESSADRGPAIHSAQTDAEEPHISSDSQEPSMPKSASMPDADVITDSEDIDIPTSVLAHGTKQVQSVHALANELDIPHLADLVLQFLARQLYPDMHQQNPNPILMDCALSVFFALSNLSEIGGMKHEYICVSPKWRSGHACRDCMFFITDPNAHGMQGMDIAQVLTFFSF